MKMSRVFRKAAERISDSKSNSESKSERTRYACNAIHIIEKVWDNQTPSIKLFEKLFKPTNQKQHHLFWANPYLTNKEQEARRLALLFAAEIAEDEGL